MKAYINENVVDFEGVIDFQDVFFKGDYFRFITFDGEEMWMQGYTINDYTFEGGEPTPEPLSEVEQGAEVATIVFVQMAQTEQLDDSTIVEHPDMFIAWSKEWTGKSGTIVRDEEDLYRSIHDVGPGQNTKPSETPAMWTRIGDPAEEWPEWSQPIGAHDAYAKGAKVSRDGKHWTSDLDDNVWEPGVHAWTEA